MSFNEFLGVQIHTKSGCKAKQSDDIPNITQVPQY